MHQALLSLFLLLIPSTAWALDIAPNASLQAEVIDEGQIALAQGPFLQGHVEKRQIEGEILRQAWRIPADQRSSYQILKDLRQKLENEGYSSVYQCNTDLCGGFDFRFDIRGFQAPELFIDLGDFYYLLMESADNHVALLISRSSNAAYVELTQVSKPAPAQSTENTLTKQTLKQLQSLGSVVLEDVNFEPGSATLSSQNALSVQALAAFLTENPKTKIALVGHTDLAGTLEGNIALSKKRAESVRKLLIKNYKINETRLSAHGIGYLAPRASNSTKKGREQNRRVVAVIASVGN